MSIRAVPRKLVVLAVAAAVTGATAVLAFVPSAFAQSISQGSQVPNSAVPIGAYHTGAFSSGQTIEVQVPANSVLQSGHSVNILECSDPGGQPANDPSSDAVCDGNTIQGNTVLVNPDGSVNYDSYTVYALPDSQNLGEPPSNTPVCNSTNYCVLYIGEDQNDFTQPYVLSEPFLVSPNSSDNGSNPGNGQSGNPLQDVVGQAYSYTFTIPGAPSEAPASVKAKKLPAGLSFTANDNGTGTISGTADPDTGGAYTLKIKEEFVNTSQEIVHGKTKTVTTKQKIEDVVTFDNYEAPTFLSPATSESATVGKSFHVKFNTEKKEFPTPPTITESGTLPSGVTFTQKGTGAELSGKPATGTEATYPITIEASNGYGTPATLSFTLTVAS
jgi:Putative Ig domain